MATSLLPHMKHPCADCPMRKDCTKGRLGKERIMEILNAGTFVCHKESSLQCAGHMILKGDENSFVQIANRLHSDVELKGQEFIFDNKESCIDHHDNRHLLDNEEL